jgi:hypothetical protein
MSASSHGTVTMSEDEFLSLYHPEPNDLNPDASFDFGSGGALYETYGEELDYIRSLPVERIWTIVDGDEGRLWLLSGWHLVNRVGYLVTAESRPRDADISVKLE